MNGNTLILSAFWESNKSFPSALSTKTDDGLSFHKHYCGEARYVGWMDLVLLKDTIQKNHIKNLILQNIDTLGKIGKDYKQIDVCICYKLNHHFIKYIPKKKLLRLCTPVYTTVEFGGWDFSENDDTISTRILYYMQYLLIHTQVDSITCMNNKIKATVYFDSSRKIVSKVEPN